MFETGEMLNRFEAVASTLNEERESEHFSLRFAYRNPRHGRGYGRRGVRDLRLVDAYANALETAYRKLIKFGWDAPGKTRNGRTPVYLCELLDLIDDGCSFTFLDQNDVPSIALPCRYNASTSAAELRYAEAAAVHEVTHVLNHGYHPLNLWESNEWEWFDDATAVFMERLLLDTNCEHLEFLQRWIDEPEVSLADERARYEGALFVQYLCRRFGGEFLARIWTTGKEFGTALEAIVGVLERKDPPVAFADATPEVADVFGSGYCVDSYFVWKLAPEVVCGKILWQG